MVVAHLAGKDLRFVGQPAKCMSMDNPIAIPLKGSPIRMGRLRMDSSDRVGGIHIA